jgi:hypothetical protein
MAFWNTYGTPIVILAGGAVGAFSSLFIDYLKDRKEQKKLNVRDTNKKEHYPLHGRCL